MSDHDDSTTPARPREPAKRPAYEPAARLMQPVAYDPRMKRPPTTVAGAVLVLLRVLAGALLLVDVTVNWKSLASTIDAALPSVTLTPETEAVGLTAVIVVGCVVLAVDAVLALLTFRGSNIARVIVMLLAVVSISSAFAGWWAGGQEITLKTSLLSLALDILVLLALSSRSAAAYARRNERP